jgi:TonB-dependent SusC/RagA subfamily outer membrane receptor
LIAAVALVLMANPLSAQQAESDTDTTNVGEVVVTALGIKKEKKKLGFAVSEIQGASLVKARETNVVDNMVGKVAGLTIGQSAELLGTSQIVLRGSDIRRGQSVLFVVDGVPINSDAYNLSPDDIEKVSVLMGPAAAALYGYRGQNGAIVITTKRGSKDGITVEVNSSAIMENGFLTIPKVQDKYGPGDHGNYSFVDGLGGGTNDGDYDVWGPALNGQLIAQYDSPVDPLTGKRTPTPFVARGANNLQRFLQAGLLNTNNFSIASSTKMMDVRFSFSNLNQRGIVPNTGLNSNTFNISNTIRFSDKFRMNATVNYNRQSTENINDVLYGPNSLIYNIVIWQGADWDVMSDDIRGIWQPGKEGVQSVHSEYKRYQNPWFVAYKWLRGHYKNDLCPCITTR